ncbi:MAG: radical SAM protein [Myxococcaceae bacterium]
MSAPITRGEVALCSLPPYSAQPWLSMGVVLHWALLEQAGVATRVVRPLDPPYEVPSSVQHASLLTLTFDPPMTERLAAMEAADRESPGFFDGLLDALLSGGERVVGLSLFRNNVDVGLHVARRLKQRSPSTKVVIGGPEAIEDPRALLLPFVDVVLGSDADANLVPTVRALLAGEAPRLRHVFTAAVPDPSELPVAPRPPRPAIESRRLLPLLQGDAQATMPVLMNWGCPYGCAYCSNRVTYGRFEEGSTDAVLAELDGLVEGWAALHPGHAPGLSVNLSDATTNALPAQFDALMDGIAARLPRWPLRPTLRGQMLFDQRVTPERVAKWKRAGFRNTFFGVDGAGAALRRTLHRPSELGHVEAAARAWLAEGLGGLTFGLPVGLPGETEEDFEAALAFAERVLDARDASPPPAHGRAIEVVTVLPYVAFRSAQDAAFSAQLGGARGVTWQAPVAGGDPKVRARRFMAAFDRLASRVEVMSPVPPYLMLPAMLPGDPAVEAWLARHGRVFDQLTPPARVRHDAPTRTEGGAAAPLAQVSVPGWRFEGFFARASSVIALFSSAGGRRVALELTPADPARRAFAHTARGNLSYLKQWDAHPCDFDETLVRACVGALERAP